MSKKRRDMSRFYTAPDAATDDLYEALCYHYWQADGYAKDLLLKISEKYEQGGYDLKETTPKASSREEAAGGPEDMAAACDLDDLDYDSVAQSGDQHPWDGWVYRHDAADFH